MSDFEKEWCLEAARLEDGQEVGAGVLADNPIGPLAALRFKLTDAQNRISRLEQESAVNRDFIMQYQREVKPKDARIEELEAELASRKTLQEYEDAISAVSKENERLEVELEERDSEISKLGGSLDEWIVDFNSLKAENISLKDENRRLKNDAFWWRGDMTVPYQSVDEEMVSFCILKAETFDLRTWHDNASRIILSGDGYGSTTFICDSVLQVPMWIIDALTEQLRRQIVELGFKVHNYNNQTLVVEHTGSGKQADSRYFSNAEGEQHQLRAYYQFYRDYSPVEKGGK